MIRVELVKLVRRPRVWVAVFLLCLLPFARLAYGAFTDGLGANPAEFLGATDKFGTVAIGRRADLILVSGNPLQDVTNAAKRVGVMIGGRWMSEAELREMLDDLVTSFR